MFCGTFDAKGAQINTGQGTLEVERPGKVRKFVKLVDQITFSGKQALKQGQEVVYVTERAVFRLISEGLELIETAPGADIERDITTQMDFMPLLSSATKVMDPKIFMDEDHA